MTMIEPPHTEGMCMRQPATEPLYDTKSEEDIFYELSERLGILEAYNGVLNMAQGLDHKPELMLELDKKYTDKEMADRKGRLWNDKGIEWYMENCGDRAAHRQVVPAMGRLASEFLHRRHAAPARSTQGKNGTAQRTLP